MRRQYPLFDYMRLALALEVVFGHFIYAIAFPAVAGFLALSGFLVTGSLERHGPGKEFAKRRLLRVMPAFFVGLGLVWALFGKSELINTAVYYIRFGFYSKGVNAPLWSLLFEEVAYIGLAIAAVLRPKRLIPIGLGIGFVLCLCGPLCDPSDSRQTLYRALPLLWSLMVGVYAASHEEEFAKLRHLGILLLFVSGAFSFVSRNPSVAALGAAPALLMIGLGYFPKLPKIPDLSYGTYIYHYPIFSAFKDIYPKWELLLATLVFAAISWYVVEWPAQKLKNWRPSPRRAKDANSSVSTEDASATQRVDDHPLADAI